VGVETHYRTIGKSDKTNLGQISIDAADVDRVVRDETPNDRSCSGCIIEMGGGRGRRVPVTPIVAVNDPVRSSTKKRPLPIKVVKVR